ncbi:MAG: anaerobic ribonucleoside-triphosphate reductase activating protein [Candidatus Diapherotrites archaeon]
MKIKGFLNESFQDYDKGLSSVIFTSKCNYKCPTCHNKRLVYGEIQPYNNEEILNLLDRRNKHINKVVITGGEPTQELDLIHFVRELKKRGLEVKLDTNGSNYSVLQDLKKENLIDYVAMDIKAPPYLYAQAVGKEYIDLRDDLQKGMGIVSQFPDYEFRTTVVPIIRENKDINFMTVEEVEDIAKFIYETTGTKDHKYFLQRFIARGEEDMINEKFTKENLPEEMHETPKRLLKEMLERVLKYLPNAKIR